MIACYDLARCPPTYDVVAFLAHAELARLRAGEEHIDLHILPGPAGGFRMDSLWPRTIEEREQMRDRVLAPLCHMLPSVKVVSVDKQREGAYGYGRDQYLISLPAILSALREGCRPLRASPDMAKGDYITLTLREAAHHPLRNSRVDEWIAAARILESSKREVIIVRDTRRADEQIAGARVSYAAPRSIQERARLYAGAALNVGICNGPMWMSIFMGAPTLMLRPTTHEAGGCYDDFFYKKCGLPRGSQLPSSPSNQRLCWEDDSRENIVRAVEEMLEETLSCHT